jgi:hypothetical protein
MIYDPITRQAVTIIGRYPTQAAYDAAPAIEVSCSHCGDSGIHPDDPTGQADCGYCGGRVKARA